MAAEREPAFTGTLTDDLALLARLVRDDLMSSAGRLVPFLDDFSIGFNNGTSLLATAAWPGLANDAAAGHSEYRVEGLAAELDAIEERYWALRQAPGKVPDPDALAVLDQEVIQILSEASTGAEVPSMMAGTHVRFAGDKAHPVWSLFVQNTPLRRLLGSAAAKSAWDIFPGGRGKEVPHVVFMSPPNPLAPLAVTVPQTVKQLRLQCLDPDVILLARRGMAIKASAAADLWRLYRAVSGRIDEETHARLRKLPWLFQSIGKLLGDEFTEPAVQALRECLGQDLQVRFWPSSREGVLRKALGSAELLSLLAAGFPDHRTASLGGAVPLLVALSDVTSTSQVAPRVQQAWDAYRQQYSETTPLRGVGVVHRPSVVLLGGIGVATAVSHADGERPAFAALIETLVAAEGARAFGGMRPLPYEEAFALLNAPLRFPVPGDLPLPAPTEDESAEPDDVSEDEDVAAAPPPRR